MKKIPWKTLIGVIISCHLLLSCKSETTPDVTTTDSTPPSKTDDTLQKGYLLDSAVAGVTYRRSDGTVGTTDADGAFDYYYGDTIEFSIGNIVLGQVQTVPPVISVIPSAVGTGGLGSVYTLEVTPLTLTPQASNNRDDPVVVNKLIFIQTLDDDGNLDNGIQISDAVRQAAQNSTIDFSQPTQEFVTGPFASLIAYLNESQAFSANTPRAIRSEIDALRHFGDLVIFPSGALYKVFKSWWRETDGCSGIGETMVTIKNSSVTFCPNITGHDGCFDGVVRANGDIMLPAMTANAICASLEAGSATYTTLQCGGAEYYDLQAGLHYTDGSITGQYEASCNQASVNAKQTLSADFLLTHSETQGLSNGNWDLFVAQNQVFDDINGIIAAGSCSIDSDCNVQALSNSCLPGYVAYAPATIDMDSFSLKTYIYGELQSEIDASQPGGLIICSGLRPPSAICVNNACQLQ